MRHFLTEEENYRIQRELGRYIRQINDIVGTHFGLFSHKETWRDSYKDFILQLFALVMEDGKKAGSDLKYITYDELWDLIVSVSKVFEEVKKPRLVLWDMWDGNIFVKDGEITGLIDYERAMWGDILMEHEFSGFSDVSPGFAAGYGKTEYTKNEQIRRCIYRIYRQLFMIVECDYRKYPDDLQYQWVTEKLKEELKVFRQLTCR